MLFSRAESRTAPETQQHDMAVPLKPAWGQMGEQAAHTNFPPTALCLPRQISNYGVALSIDLHTPREVSTLRTAVTHILIELNI